ncbi:hypothetical protein SAMN05216184_11364 [Georgenia satyanarayanai]|uniref:Lipoprotein n=1 Tax=Georgenia satyanarayanai TaxID=860221 RepID=A0A2Y9C7G0_9MICO|nr:hypothetical protein [Georgenia satyanarayanai]PYF97889.1 hypothetical protein A8987_11364 [Georgenia satyanarayanai]SSA45463.1 hypothetical protein SAMN05216184_11364 [Georgenia satyanarayanai]
MGRHATIGTAGLVLLGGLAAGCSAPGPGEAEIQDWLDERPRAVVDDAVAAMSAAVPAARPDAAEPAATLHIGQPADVAGLRAECLGDGTLLVTMEVPNADGNEAVELEVDCGDGPHEESFALPGAQSATVDVFGDADYVGAVYVEVLGETTSRR